MSSPPWPQGGATRPRQVWLVTPFTPNAMSCCGHDGFSEARPSRGAVSSPPGAATPPDAFRTRALTEVVAKRCVHPAASQETWTASRAPVSFLKPLGADTGCGSCAPWWTWSLHRGVSWKDRRGPGWRGSVDRVSALGLQGPSSIPVEGRDLGCRLDPVQEAAGPCVSHVGVPLCLSPLLALRIVERCPGRKGKRRQVCPGAADRSCASCPLCWAGPLRPLLPGPHGSRTSCLQKRRVGSAWSGGKSPRPATRLCPLPSGPTGETGPWSSRAVPGLGCFSGSRGPGFLQTPWSP